MVFCIIPGCGNTSTRDKGVYSRVPKIVTHCGHQQEEITTRRRTLWLDAIARPDLNENIILSERVCFRHFISGKPAASWDQNNPDWIPNQNLSTQEMHLTSADCVHNIRPSKRSQNTPSPAKRAQSRSKPSPGKRAKKKISLLQDDEYTENLPSPEPGSQSESEPLHLKCEQIENEDSFPPQSERFQCVPLLAEIAQQSHIVSFIDEHKVGEVKMVEEENKSEQRCSARWASTRSRDCATPNLVSILKQRPSQNSPLLTPQHSKRNKSTSLLVLPQQQKHQFQKSFVLPGKSSLPPMLQYQIFNKRFSSPVTPLKFECCVPFCKNNSYDGPGRFLSFHGFPNDPIIRKKWIASIKKDDDESFEVLSSTKVCSDHFLPNEIVLSETGRRKIKTGCVPHIFMWNLDVDCDEVSPAKSYDWSPRLGTPDDGDPSDLESSHQTTFEDNSKENEGFGNSESTSEFLPVIVKTEQVDDDYYEEHGVNNQTNDVENHFSDVAVKMECVPDEMDSTEQQLPTVLEEHQPPPAFVFNTQRCLDLCKSLFNFYENGIFCDTIVITKNKQLQAHSIVMAAWSPFCLSILNSKRVAGACIIDLSTFDSDTVETVLNYMYTGELRMFENKMKVDQFSKLYALMKTLGLPFNKANDCSNKVVQSIEINNVPEVTGIHKNRTNNLSDDRSPPRFLTKRNKSVQPGDQEMVHNDSTERNLRNRNKKPLLKIKLSAKKLQVVDDVDNVKKIKSKSRKVQNSRFESGSPVPDDGSEPADVEPSAEFEVIDDVDEKQTFHCQYCGISCTTLFDLNDHYENFHSNTPLLACSVCKQLFQKQSHMKAHMRWKHGMVYKPSKEIFKYLCDLCGSNFRRVSNLKRHYLTNHPDSKPYVCEVCRKCFRLFHQLKIHLRIHTKERPYQCQYCPKTFRTISNRQIHHHTHAAKKPYECTTCSKGFAAKVNWKIHMKKKHNING